MPQTNALDIPCDWRAAFNLSPSRRGTFGYLLQWSGIGGLMLAKDIVVWNPIKGAGTTSLTDKGTTLPCVGIFERLQFGGDESDPIRISCLVSKENHTSLSSKLAQDLLNTKFKCSFALVSYDESAKSWYDSVQLRSPTTLDAAVNTVDGHLQISTDAKPTVLGENLNIEVFRFEFEMIARPGKVAEIQLATGPTQRFIKKWLAA